MTGQDPMLPSEDEALPLEDRLSDAALAALMDDPYEAGLRIARDDGVAAALPAVARELAYHDRAVVATQGRLAGLAAAPVAVVPAAVQAPAVASGETELPGAAVAATPAGGDAPSGLGAIAAAGARLLPVDRAAARVASMPSVPAPVPVASANGDAAPGLGRLDWGGVDWGRLAAPPAMVSPAAPVPPAPDQMAASPAPDAVDRAGWPAWSAAHSGEMAMPSAAPDTSVMAQTEDGGFGRFAGRQGAAAMPEQGSRDGAEEATDGDMPGLGGVLKVDGALLGRFIAEQLGREAGRPPAGMTGFDPLVSPAWMSAYQG